MMSKALPYKNSVETGLKLYQINKLFFISAVVVFKNREIEKNRNLNDTKYQLHKIWLFRYYHQSTYQ